MPPALPDYDELEIRLTPGRGDAYNVEIESASGARGHGQFIAPAELDIASFRLMVDPRNRRVRGSSRYLKAAQRFGGGLFDALMAAPSVHEVYTAARRDARTADRGMRVTFSLRAAPELTGIPWEFLYDRPRFLANHKESPVVRFVDLEDPPPPLRVEAPLRILGMVSRPKDDALATLDAEEEQAALKQRLGPLIDVGQVTLRWLERATLPALQQEVDHGEDFHVFHYIGHGEYDEDSGESSLILEHPDRRAHRVGGQQLGELLCEQRSLRLAVLNACETAQTARQDPLAGIATSLMEYDVPAVVAMQFAITDEGALIFADEFYRALADGYAVDAAVTQARRALAAHSDVEWATPVLFMRVADGRLFEVHPATSRATAETTHEPETPRTERDLSESSIPASAERQTGAAAGHAVAREPSENAPPSALPTPTFRHAREFVRLTHDDTVGRVVFSRDGTRIATASRDGTARVWDSTSGRELALARVAHDGEFGVPFWRDCVQGVAFSPDGKRIATGSRDLTARVWDSASGRELIRLKRPGALGRGKPAHDDWIMGVAFSPDGMRIATASHDNTARVWDSTSGHELACLPHDGWVLGVAFSPDGTRIATASLDGTVRLWGSASDRPTARLEGHTEMVLGVAFNPDGTRIATASWDGTARIWDSASGHELTRVEGGNAVAAVAFSPDGKRIATASYETACVWDSASGRELARIPHEYHEVWDVAFCPDGTRLATACGGPGQEHDILTSFAVGGGAEEYGYAIVWGID